MKNPNSLYLVLFPFGQEKILSTEYFFWFYATTSLRFGARIVKITVQDSLSDIWMRNSPTNGEDDDVGVQSRRGFDWIQGADLRSGVSKGCDRNSDHISITLGYLISQ